MHDVKRLGLGTVFLLAVTGTALAETNGDATSASAGDQFKSAGQNIGAAAQKIGQGIKQGAIQTWEAVRAGASAASDKLNGHSTVAPTPPPSTASH
jgi:hypothetical protein